MAGKRASTLTPALRWQRQSLILRQPHKISIRSLGPEGRPAKREPSPEGLGHRRKTIPSAVGAAPCNGACPGWSRRSDPYSFSTAFPAFQQSAPLRLRHQVGTLAEVVELKSEGIGQSEHGLLNSTDFVIFKSVASVSSGHGASRQGRKDTQPVVTSEAAVVRGRNQPIPTTWTNANFKVRQVYCRTLKRPGKR
jgi:hypothetical protein